MNNAWMNNDSREYTMSITPPNFFKCQLGCMNNKRVLLLCSRGAHKMFDIFHGQWNRPTCLNTF